MRALVVLCLLGSVAHANPKLPSGNPKSGDWTHFEIERDTGDSVMQGRAVAIVVPMHGIQWLIGGASFDQTWNLMNLHPLLQDLAAVKGTKLEAVACPAGNCTRLTYRGEIQTFGTTSKLVIVATHTTRGTGIFGLEVTIDGKLSWRIKAIGFGNGSKASWGQVGWTTSFPVGRELPVTSYVTPEDLGRAIADRWPDLTPLAITEVKGPLDQAIIRRYLKRSIQKLTYCYEKELLAKPKLGGTIDMTFTIGGDGKVTTAAAKGVDREVENCTASVVKSIEFPKPKNASTVDVAFTFRYQPMKPGKKI